MVSGWDQGGPEIGRGRKPGVCPLSWPATVTSGLLPVSSYDPIARQTSAKFYPNEIPFGQRFSGGDWSQVRSRASVSVATGAQYVSYQSVEKQGLAPSENKNRLE